MYNAYQAKRNVVFQFKCTSKYYAAGAVCFPRAIKKGHNYMLTVSLFELQQIAKAKYLSSSRRVSIPSYIPSDITLSDDILKFVTSTRCRSSLYFLKTQFHEAYSLEFYTDGSLCDLGHDTSKMGIGWIQCDSRTSTIGRFSAQVERFPSSTRAEIYSILSALCTVPFQCSVSIKTDSQATVNLFQLLLEGNSLFNTNQQRSLITYFGLPLSSSYLHIIWRFSFQKFCAL